MSVSNWQTFISQTDNRMVDLRTGIPGVTKGFHEVARSAIKDGALDAKTKELIALPRLLQSAAGSERCRGV